MKWWRDIEVWKLIGQIALCLLVILAVILSLVWWWNTCHDYLFQPILNVPQICVLRR